MTASLILPLSDCMDPDLAGGKAVGLARLLERGFSVPPGVCLTTRLYEEALHSGGLDHEVRWNRLLDAQAEDRAAILAECRAAILKLSFPAHFQQLIGEAIRNVSASSTQLWAVRSSATDEDRADASFAGLYRSELGIAGADCLPSILRCWASLWSERVWEYHQRAGLSRRPPRMAVILQPVIPARASGVVYSIDPLTKQPDRLAIDAVPGLATLLVAGIVTPDHYLVRVGADGAGVVTRQTIAVKSSVTRLGNDGLVEEQADPGVRDHSTLTDKEATEIAVATKRIENSLGHAVDVEWALENSRMWLLQVRPIAGTVVPGWFTNKDCDWSRANFKETLPELPSPLGLSFLERFMDHNMVRHYRELGCIAPPNVTSVRIVRGRPYINVTLFQSFMAQLGGEPSLLTEQMGGEGLSLPVTIPRLGVWKLVRAGVLLLRQMRQAVRRAPRWFSELKQMADDNRPEALHALTIRETVDRLKQLGKCLEGQDMTFAIVAGVGQSLHAVHLLLRRWIGDDWRLLLNGALQGQGNIISALQIVRLAEVAQAARREPNVRRFFAGDPFEPSAFQKSLDGTQFLRLFEQYLADFGHRGIGESDIMSPSFADRPELLLGLIREQVRDDTCVPPDAILRRQEAARQKALTELRRRFGWHGLRWVVFYRWYRRLCRFLALREANRHHLMFFTSGVRNVMRRLGTLMAEQGLIGSPDDVFFMTMEEQMNLLSHSDRDWKTLLAARKAERMRNAEFSVPDTIHRSSSEQSDAEGESARDSGDVLRGIPISVGSVTGPVRLVLTAGDLEGVRKGDIVIAPVIDPGMTPVMGIAGGLVAEMGGTLSHGAIIAREFGLPTVANVPGITKVLQDGELVSLDAAKGEIQRLGAPRREPQGGSL